METDKLEKILSEHRLWLNGEGGKQANLYQADLRHADLRHANLYQANLYQADLRHANLYQANLYQANLYQAKLYNANLCNANLYLADLRHANLRYTNLRQANLYQTDLRHADLYNAYLYHADLRHANLSNADLSNAALGFDAYFAVTVGQPIYQASCGFGSRNATLTLFAKGQESEWVFFTGCFSGSYSDLIQAVEANHGAKNQAKYLLAINYLLAIARTNVGVF